MKQRFPIWLIIAGCVLAGWGGWQWMHRPSDSNSTGASAIPDIQLTEYRQLQSRIAKNLQVLEATPDHIQVCTELAGQYVQLSRLTGFHDTYVPRALTLLDKVLARDPQNFLARVMKAEVLLIQHQFAAAKALAQAAASQYPQSAVARGLLSDACLQLGDYAAAVAVCDRMLSIRPDLPAYSRAAYLRELHGDTDGAISAMKLAAGAGVTGRYDRAWALVQMGNLYLQKGAPDTAAFIYEGVLQERPAFAPALSGLADVACARENYARAAVLLEQAYRQYPDHAYEEKLAAIYRKLGRPDRAGAYIDAVLRGYQRHEAGGWNVNLEFARFCGDFSIRLAEALARIEKEYQVRPGNIDVLDAYAWILHRLDRHEEAAELMRRALRLNTNLPAMNFRAAQIFRHAGAKALAAEYWARCEPLRAVLPVQYAAVFSQSMRVQPGLAAMVSPVRWHHPLVTPANSRSSSAFLRSLPQRY